MPIRLGCAVCSGCQVLKPRIGEVNVGGDTTLFVELVGLEPTTF